MTVAQEALGAMRVVKAFGQEERESVRYGRACGPRPVCRPRCTP